MIELKQVTKEYGRAAVLKNITLTLEEPGIYCLLSYVFLAACISLANTFIHLVIDPLYPTRRVINLMDVCGWTGNGLGPARGCSPQCNALSIAEASYRRDMLPGAAPGLRVPPDGRNRTHHALCMSL